MFPRRCPVCGEIVKPAGGLICPPCSKKLSPVLPPVCKKCGKEILNETMEYCEDCLTHRHTFEYGAALLNYDETAGKIMAQIKYRNRREYLDFFGKALAAGYGKKIRNMRVDALIPVPIHRARRRTRGFNQAEILADVMGEYLDIPVYPDILVRERKTRPQKELSAQERLKNLSGAFRVQNLPAVVRSVLLVDDIYTTGSTIEICARTLKAAGVEHIYFAVICMTGGR